MTEEENVEEPSESSCTETLRGTSLMGRGVVRQLLHSPVSRFYSRRLCLILILTTPLSLAKTH